MLPGQAEQLGCPGERLDGLREFTRLLEGVAEVEQRRALQSGVAAATAELRRAPEGLDGPVEPPGDEEQLARLGPGRRSPRPVPGSPTQPGGFAERCLGPVRPAQRELLPPGLQPVGAFGVTAGARPPVR